MAFIFIPFKLWIYNVSSLAYGFTNPFGGGIGNWKLSSLQAFEAMNIVMSEK